MKSTPLFRPQKKRAAVLGVSGAALGLALAAGLSTAAVVKAANEQQAQAPPSSSTNTITEAPAPPPMMFHHRIENREAVLEAIKQNDYDAWVEAVAPQERFDELVKAYQEDGEEGLQPLQHKPDFFVPGLPVRRSLGEGGMKGPNQEIIKQLQAGNYEEWKAALTEDLQSHDVDQTTIDEMTSQEAFEKMQQVDQFIQQGDHESAHELMQKLPRPEPRQ